MMTRRTLWTIVALLLMLGGLPAARAGGSYATTGTGTYAQSLWWLDFSGYSNATAAGGGQAFGFTLPGGAGTFSTTLALTGNGTLQAVAIPAWSGGGAIGHGAYNGITGSPDLYWLGQNGVGTVSLNSMVVKDAAGNPRNFTFYAADGENTNNSESITYISSATWKLIDTVNYYASFNGGVPTLAGAGTTTVTQSAPSTGDNNDNATLILSTQSPTQVSAALSGNEAVMFAVALPTVALTVNVASRLNSSDQFLSSIAYTSPSSTVKNASSSGTASTVSMGSTTVIGANSMTLGISMVSGSASPIAYYSGSISCTNSGPGASGYGGTNTTLPSGAGTAFTITPQVGDAIACTLNVTPVTQTLTGSVYGDLNHDAALDNGEVGTGLANLYVKLSTISAGVCQNPASAVAAVNTSSGVYSLTGVVPGSYCMTLTNSSALSNTTAYLPPGYVGTEAATGIRQLSVGASPLPVQNFGLFSGSTLTATVFADNGSANGTANDGIQNGGEPGIGNVVVSASSGGTAVATATTSAGGIAMLWLPGSAQGTLLSIVPTAPSGTTPTGGTAGNSGGTYSRPMLSFTSGVGQSYTGVSFGLVIANGLTTSGAQSVLAGSIVFYPHTFTAGSGGQVTFGTSATPSPGINGWSELVYLDSTCSGQFASNDTVITAPIAMSAGQSTCILIREFAPANAPVGATDSLSVKATFAYNGAAAPAAATLTQTDLTTVSGAGTVQLTKRVQNVSSAGGYAASNSVLPGQTLQYQLTAINQGSTAVSNVTIDDATPAYSTYVSSSCPVAATLPAGLTCTVTAQPAVGASGAVQWAFTGSLPPGGQTQVTLQVQVTQ